MDFLIKIGSLTVYALKVISALFGGLVIVLTFAIVKLLSDQDIPASSWTFSLAFLGGLMATPAYDVLVAIYTKVTGQWPK